jgi:hypothetical protein
MLKFEFNTYNHEKCSLSAYAICESCGHDVRLNNFCVKCGQRVAVPFYEYYDNPSFVDDLELKCLAKLEETCGLKVGKFDIEISRNSEGLTISAFSHHPSCARCGKPTDKDKHFCGKCGNRVNQREMYKLSRISFTYDEFYNVAKKWFYDQHPELRPEQEQKYLFSVAVYRKWNGHADFCDEPFITLTAQSTKDKIHGIADLNEEFLNEDDEATMLIEHDVGEIFADCIENRWLEGNNFRDEHIVEKTCSYGDKHEFLIVVTIDEVN